MVLKVQQLNKSFGKITAVSAVSFAIDKGEVFTLLGPSGCGKTTTLRLVAGLEEPDSGDITYDDRLVLSVTKNIFVPPYRRNMGMVFQSYAVWPHMTVFENVAYPLRLRHVSSNVVAEKVRHLLELVGMAGFEDRPAPLLSGGQQQRLALARALIYEPALLILDEPFSSLDAKLREQMRLEIKLLQRRLRISVLFVTHDQIEALSLSDRIAILNNGTIEQIGSPAYLYQNPQTAFVRDFLGKTVVIQGIVNRFERESLLEIRIKGSPSPIFTKSQAVSRLDIGQSVYLSIRPEDISLIPNCGKGPCTEENLLRGTIDALLFHGDRLEVNLRLEGGERILCYVPGRFPLKEGQMLAVKLPGELINVWPG
jgi:ABC-type Fe3+/spermidine/putrescine transport system ATPase subunit